MNKTIGFQKLRIFFQEPRIRQTLACSWFLRLRIREGDPDLGNFPGGETIIDEVDPRTKKSDIIQFLIQRLPRTVPNTVSLNVHADVVAIVMVPCETDCVFAFSATKLKDNGL